MPYSYFTQLYHLTTCLCNSYEDGFAFLLPAQPPEDNNGGYAVVNLSKCVMHGEILVINFSLTNKFLGRLASLLLHLTTP